MQLNFYHLEIDGTWLWYISDIDTGRLVAIARRTFPTQEDCLRNIKLITDNLQITPREDEQKRIEEHQTQIKDDVTYPVYSWMGLDGWPRNADRGSPPRQIYHKGLANPDSNLEEGEILPNEYDVLQILKAHDKEIRHLRKVLEALLSK